MVNWTDKPLSHYHDDVLWDLNCPYGRIIDPDGGLCQVVARVRGSCYAVAMLERIAHTIYCWFMALGFFCVGIVLFVLEVTVGPTRAARVARWFYRGVGIQVDDDG